MGLLLADLGVTKTHSRPYVSNDNPYSRVSVQDDEVLSSVSGAALVPPKTAGYYCCGFFDYYNFHHRHSGIGQYDTWPSCSLWSEREQLNAPLGARHLLEAQQAHPERFVRGTPQTARFASAGLDQPAAGKNDAQHDAASSPSRGGVHTWGTPFSASAQPDLGRC